jgi:hypothetical protein
MSLRRTVNIRVFGMLLAGYSRETLEIEKDFCSIPEVYNDHDKQKPILKTRFVMNVGNP